jgi:hypothetical protein
MLAPLQTTAHSITVNVRLDIAGTLVCGVAERNTACSLEGVVEVWENKMFEIKQRITGSSNIDPERRSLPAWQ